MKSFQKFDSSLTTLLDHISELEVILGISLLNPKAWVFLQKYIDSQRQRGEGEIRDWHAKYQAGHGIAENDIEIDLSGNDSSKLTIEGKEVYLSALHAMLMLILCEPHNPQKGDWHFPIARDFLKAVLHKHT